MAEYYAADRVEADAALVVDDDNQHAGIGTVLLEDLAVIARGAGFRRLHAATLPTHVTMRQVLRAVGLQYREWFEDGLVHSVVDLTTEHLMRDQAERRDWQAAVASLRPIVDPRHVVVVGAGPRPHSPGRRILARLEESFEGRVSVVHPELPQADGVPAVRHVGELDTVPDLAIVAVRAAAVCSVIEECGRAGVAAAIIISSGFAEVGQRGVQLQHQALAMARAHGMRLLGPNCLGVVSTGCGLNATFTDQPFRMGRLAIAAQSGGVGIAVGAEAARRGAGVSSFVSLGNRADVGVSDLLRLWADDEATGAVLLYLESVGDPTHFARVARAVSRRKPIVALKGGRSPAGRRAAGSQTAAVASDQLGVDALLEGAGVIRARNLEELVDIGLLLIVGTGGCVAVDVRIAVDRTAPLLRPARGLPSHTAP